MEKFTSHRYYFLKIPPPPKNLQAIEVAPNNHKYPHFQLTKISMKKIHEELPPPF